MISRARLFKGTVPYIALFIPGGNFVEFQRLFVPRIAIVPLYRDSSSILLIECLTTDMRRF